MPATVYTSLAMQVHPLRQPPARHFIQVHHLQRAPARRLLHKCLRFLRQRCPPMLVPATVYTLLATPVHPLRRGKVLSTGARESK